MKIITLKASHILTVSFCAALLLTLISVFRLPKVQDVFSSGSGRSLPIYSVQTDEKKAALGINCAWDDADIPDMLAALAQRNIKASFFLLGEWAQKYPDSAKAIALAGHEIGSHSNSHRDMSSLSQHEILEEISASRAAIQNACSQTPVLFRPPSGDYNDLVIESIHQSGCIPIQWNLDTLDWKGLEASEIAERVRKDLAPGSIILLHAGAEHSAQALPLILDAADQLGIQLVPVGELIYPDSSTVDHAGQQLKPQS